MSLRDSDSPMAAAVFLLVPIHQKQFSPGKCELDLLLNQFYLEIETCHSIQDKHKPLVQIVDIFVILYTTVSLADTNYLGFGL